MNENVTQNEPRTRSADELARYIGICLPTRPINSPVLGLTLSVQEWHAIQWAITERNSLRVVNSALIERLKSENEQLRWENDEMRRTYGAHPLQKEKEDTIETLRTENIRISQHCADLIQEMLNRGISQEIIASIAANNRG